MALLDPHDHFPTTGSAVRDHPLLLALIAALLSPLIPLTVWAVTACVHSLGLF